MPLTAANMFPGGPIKSADAIEYFNLLTGAMTDQPVTLANTLAAGGFHGVGSVPFRVNGVAAQTANMQEVRALGADVNPIFAIGPDGTLKWGPGGGTATDTTLSRSSAGVLQPSGLLIGASGLTITAGGLRVTAGNIGVGVAPTTAPITFAGSIGPQLLVSGTPTSGYGIGLNAGEINLFCGAGQLIGFRDTAYNGTQGGTITPATGLLTVVGPNGGIKVTTSTGNASTVGGQLYIGSLVASTATAGGDGAPPAGVAGYLIWQASGATIKVPYYNN